VCFDGVFCVINQTSEKNKIFEMPEIENCRKHLLSNLQNFEDFED